MNKHFKLKLISLKLVEPIYVLLFRSKLFSSMKLISKSGTVAHCAFSSNLFHGQIAQIYIDHLSGHENKKCSP